MKYSVYPRKDGLYNITVYYTDGSNEKFYALTQEEKDDTVYRLQEDLTPTPTI